MTGPDRTSLIRMINLVSGFTEMRFTEVGHVTPIYYIVTASGKKFVTPMPPIDKDLATQVMRRVLKDQDAIRVVFIDEAWVVKSTAASQEAIEDFAAEHSLGEHPDSIEIIVFIGEDEYGEILARRRIERPQGQKARLLPLEFMEMDATAGRMTGMLPRRGRTQ